MRLVFMVLNLSFLSAGPINENMIVHLATTVKKIGTEVGVEVKTEAEVEVEVGLGIGIEA